MRGRPRHRPPEPQEVKMSATGLDVFDKTLQTTNVWLNEIGETLGPDRQRNYHALRAVLFALRDRLTPEEAFHLSAELPMLVRGVFWESYRPSGKPERYRARDEFLEKVQDGLGQIAPMNAEDCARAVFGVLERHVPKGEIEDVRHMLPEDVRTLFPEMPDEARPR
jgi:uncharacterized protein (DUF2267 family)